MPKQRIERDEARRLMEMEAALVVQASEPVKVTESRTPPDGRNH